MITLESILINKHIFLAGFNKEVSLLSSLKDKLIEKLSCIELKETIKNSIEIIDSQLTTYEGHKNELLNHFDNNMNYYSFYVEVYKLYSIELPTNDIGYTYLLNCCDMAVNNLNKFYNDLTELFANSTKMEKLTL